MNSTSSSDPDQISSISNPSGDGNNLNTRRRNLHSSPSQNLATLTASQTSAAAPKWFQSRKIKRGTFERPWKDIKDPREKWVTIIPIIGMIVGFTVAGLLIWDGLRQVVNHEYCLVLNEDWSTGFNEKIWTKEAEVGGFGNGEFEETTTTVENAFVQNGMLYIKPTLQDKTLLETNGSIINLLNSTSTTCSSTSWADCVAITNLSNGTIIPPVRSARVSTRSSTKIKYGRVEVTARLPRGDWLWPAIWMLPVNSTYGGWPRSGEIDIAESRGNGYRYPLGGNNIVSSSLHWGPDATNDAWWRTHQVRAALHSSYADRFHTFGMEWSEKYLFTYVDNRIIQVLYVDFSVPFWEKGWFPLADNGTKLEDPWSFTGKASTPFDQEFYLILSLGIGGTNGWFEDGKANKPWVDSSSQAKLDFWNAKDEWWPTWQSGGEMSVKSVKIWQQKGYVGC